MNNKKLRSLASCCLALLALLAGGLAQAAEPAVQSLVLVNTRELGRAAYEYTYKIVVSNPDMPRTGMRATVTSTASTTLVVHGRIAIGDMAAGTTATPVGTITIRQNHSYPFNPASLRWRIHGRLASGLAYVTSNGVRREYYLRLPSDYYPVYQDDDDERDSRHGDDGWRNDGDVRMPCAGSPSGSTAARRTGFGCQASAKPLVMAFHATTGSYLNWTQGYYDFQSVVGDGAILVYPQALVQANNITQWNFEYDFQFFNDIVAELNAKVRYNHNKLFITGHSSGAGMAHEIGCRYGDIVRAIGPVAGALISTSCTGAVGVIQIQGSKDALAPPEVTIPTHRFWVLYNGFVLRKTVPGITPPCVNSALVPSDYPVQWCLHDEGTDGLSGHAWPSFASHAIWDFFSGLSELPPGPNPPPGGGNAAVASLYDTTYSFTLYFPPGIPQPLLMAASLYAAGQQQPVFTAPIDFLNTSFSPGPAIGGATVTYSIPVRYQDFGGSVTFPGTYAFEVVAYVQGGTYPIPTTGVDYTVFHDIFIPDKPTPLVIPGVLTLEPVQSF